MAQKVIIDPVTRIEGHLKLEVEVDGGRVIDAHSSGSLFRGIELILQGRDPRDAQQFVMRICGVCPLAHTTAAALALDEAFKVEVPQNGRILRNLILGSNFIQSNILHFYHLAALDYVDIVKAGLGVAPFVPRYEVAGEYRLPDALNKAAVEQYLKALDMRKKAHEMLALFGGRAPHPQAIVPGGVTEVVDAQKVIDFVYRLKELQAFIEEEYVPTVKAVAQYYPDYLSIGGGTKNMLSYGGFSQSQADYEGADGFFKRGGIVDGKDIAIDAKQITEEVKYSWYEDDTNGTFHPDGSVVTPAPEKTGAYSWLKAPRYEGRPMEVGPLARQLVMKNPELVALGNGAYSVIGRHLARAVECLSLSKEMEKWAMALVPGGPTCNPHVVPNEAEGKGLTEGPRGALGHWIGIKGGVTQTYNAVVPTTWNASPRDSKGQRGPIEEACIGTPVKDPNNPIELVRIVRAFDPCLGCAIHLMTPDKKVLAECRVY